MPEAFLLQRRPRATVGRDARVAAGVAAGVTGRMAGGADAGAARTSVREPRAVPSAAGFVPSPRPAAAGAAQKQESGVAASEPAASVTDQWERHPVLRPLRAFVDEPGVTDVFVNGAAGMFVDRGAGPVPVHRWRAAEADVREIAVALVALGGRHIDDAAPAVDVRLDGGLRVHAVLPPLAPDGTVISIRVPRLDRPDLDALERGGMFPAAVRGHLEQAVAARVNLLVTGAAGAGKTTLLASLLGAAPAHERIVTIEDVAELRIDHPHHVRLEARQANLEGAGGIGLARLVREALRMRPDRLVVGECRGAEIRELLSALNTGHDGGAGTVHANSLRDVPARLEALGALAGLDDTALARQVMGAIGLIVHVARRPDGSREIAGAARPGLAPDGRLRVEELPWHV